MLTEAFPEGIRGDNQDKAQAAVGKTEAEMRAAGWKNKDFKFFLEKKPNLKWAEPAGQAYSSAAAKRKAGPGGAPGGKRAKA